MKTVISAILILSSISVFAQRRPYETATQAEVDAGTNPIKAVTPKTLKNTSLSFGGGGGNNTLTTNNNQWIGSNNFAGPISFQSTINVATTALTPSELSVLTGINTIIPIESRINGKLQATVAAIISTLGFSPATNGGQIVPSQIISNGTYLANGILSTNSGALPGGFLTELGTNRLYSYNAGSFTNYAASNLAAFGQIPAGTLFSAQTNGNIGGYLLELINNVRYQTFNANRLTNGPATAISNNLIIPGLLSVGETTNETFSAIVGPLQIWNTSARTNGSYSYASGQIHSNGVGSLIIAGGGLTTSNFLTGAWSLETNGISTRGTTNNVSPKITLDGTTGIASFLGNINMGSSGSINVPGGAQAYIGAAAVTKNQFVWGTIGPSYFSIGQWENTNACLGYSSGQQNGTIVPVLYWNSVSKDVVVVGKITATNGFASYKNNTAVNTPISVTASPFNYTNTTGVNIFVDIDANGGTTTVARNGTTVYTALVNGDHEMYLKPNGYLTVTYSIATPIMGYTEQ